MDPVSVLVAASISAGSMQLWARAPAGGGERRINSKYPRLWTVFRMGGGKSERRLASSTRGHDNANIMTTLPRVNRSAASVPIVFCARVQVQRFRIRCSSFLPFARRTRSFAGAEFSSRFSFFSKHLRSSLASFLVVNLFAVDWWIWLSADVA